MKTHFEKALDYVRENIDVQYTHYCIVKAMEMRCTVSQADALMADEVADLLEEYGQDNDLPEGWWCEYGDIDEIVEQL